MELPAKITKYESEEILCGGMSHVFRARGTVIGRTVAIKILTGTEARTTPRSSPGYASRPRQWSSGLR
jgi:hypothetical protein